MFQFSAKDVENLVNGAKWLLGFEESGHQWTDYHNSVVNYHLQSGRLPHPETHNKAEAQQWALQVGRSLNRINQSSMVASFAALALHLGLSELQAKQFVLGIAEHLYDVSGLSKAVGVLWDQLMTHQQSHDSIEIASSGRTVNNYIKKRLS